MARRVRAYEEYAGPGARGRPRRRRGNEGVWIALGAAAIVGLVFLLVISGSSSGEAEKAEAAVVFERFLKALLENDERVAMEQVSLADLLVEYDPQVRKSWPGMNPEERKKVRWEVFRWLGFLMKNQLRLEAMSEVRRKVLDKAEVTWDAGSGWVQYRWMSEGYRTVIAERHMLVPPEPWVARISNVTGSFKVVKFGPEARR